MSQASPSESGSPEVLAETHGRLEMERLPRTRIMVDDETLVEPLPDWAHWEPAEELGDPDDSDVRGGSS